MAEAVKHIFLTGNIQTGKSTILKALIDDHRDLKLGGMFTRWINKQNAAKAGLYLFPADRKVIDIIWSGTEPLNEKLVSETNLIASFDSGNYKKKIVNKAVFNELGRQYLKKSRNADLILIDEIGILEDKAYAFQEEVSALLGGDTQIIGVVRNKPGVLTDIIKQHPRVELIEVTRANRNELKETLLARLKEQFPSR